MIFISVGSESFKFNRLLKIIDDSICKDTSADKIFAQIGNSTYRPVHFSYTRFLPYNDLMKYIKKSKIIVTHSGVGTIINCLQNDKIPIVFPRLKKFKEQVDDHQLELTKYLDKEKRVLAAYNPVDLVYKINNYHKLVNSIKKYNKNNRNRDILIKNLFRIRSFIK